MTYDIHSRARNSGTAGLLAAGGAFCSVKLPEFGRVIRHNQADRRSATIPPKYIKLFFLDGVLRKRRVPNMKKLIAGIVVMGLMSLSGFAAESGAD